MGFFSNIKNRARQQASSPVRPNPGNIGGNLGSDFRAPQIEDMRFRGRAPQKQGGLGGLFRKLQEQIKNQQRPQQMPQQNLDFLSRLPQNMMPQVDFSNLPQMSGNPNIPAPDGYELREDEKGMNYFREQLSPEDQAQNMLPRRLDVPFQDFNLQNMRPGFVAGGPLSRAALSNIYRKNATARGIPVPGNLQSIYTSSLPDRLRRGTENLIMGGTGAGVLLGLDGTQELREPFSKDNISVMSPEAFGKDMAQLRMDVGAVINLAKNKANEIGADINEYVSRARSAYDQQMNQDMENQRMQELDAQQGMQPFSALLGPNMPLTAPDGRPLSPMGIKLQEMINSGRRFITPRDDSELAEQQKLQNLEMQMEQQQAIDDMLLNLKKKN
jgi:hypothetical protein